MIGSKRNLIGQIVEFNFGDFYAYGLVTHVTDKYRHLLRLYRPKFEHPVKNVRELESTPFRMDIFFPLAYLRRAPELRLIGEKKLTDEELTYPAFKSVGLAPNGEKASGWWIIKGQDEKETETWVEKLTQEMSHYSKCGIYSLEAVRDLYDADKYPNSRMYLDMGPLAFDP